MSNACNVASPDFIKQLEQVEPSVDRSWRFRPCRLILKDGRVVDRAICMEDHRGFINEDWIHPDAVSWIETSKERMPAAFASTLYAAGESGMGYVVFKMLMKDGTSHVFGMGSAVVDFPIYPDGYGESDVAAVFPHEGREETKYGYRDGRTFNWCYYVKE